MNIKTKFLNFKQSLYPYGFRHDAWTVTKRAFAFTISYVFTVWTIPTVSLAFVGRLGDQQRDACGLALAVYNLVGNAVLTGANFGCDTLLPQCYGGNKRKMGIIVQRAAIIDFYACFIIWTLMLNAKYVLQLIETDTYVVDMVNEFLQIYIIIVPLDGLSSILRMYIGSNGKTIILIVMNVIGNLINILSHYICLFVLNMGIRGAAVSIILAYASIVITAIIYIRFSSIYKETWHPITRACLQEWNIYLKLALPGIMLMMVQIWSVELGVFFASPLGINSLSAQVIVQQIVWLFFLIMEALGDAGNVLIGQYLGANKPMQAANAKNITYTLAIIQSIFNGLFILITHHWLPLLFNIDADALSLARHCLLLAVIVSFVDGFNAVQTAMVKACGMQRYGAVFLFTGFYVVGLPSAYMLMYILHLNIYGFWIGMLLAEALIDVLLFILIRTFNWNACSKQAGEHIRLPESSIYNTNDSLSLSKTDEHMKLLSDTTDGQNNDTNELNKTTSQNSLFKLIGLKLLVFIPFFTVFILSLINSVRQTYK